MQLKRRRREQEAADEQLAQRLQEKKRKVAPKKTKSGTQPPMPMAKSAAPAVPQPEVDQHMYCLQQDVAKLKMQIQETACFSAVKLRH